MKKQPRYRVIDTVTGRLISDVFVLQPRKDPIARAALELYGRLTSNKSLAITIDKWLKSLQYRGY